MFVEKLPVNAMLEATGRVIVREEVDWDTGIKTPTYEWIGGNVIEVSFPFIKAILSGEIDTMHDVVLDEAQQTLTIGEYKTRIVARRPDRATVICTREGAPAWPLN